MKRSKENQFYQYLLTILITLIAVGIQYLIIHDAKIAVPGILYPSTFLIAWYFGLSPAVIAIIIGLFSSNFLFYEPRYTLKLLHFEDAVRMSIFAASSFFAAWIVARGRDAQIGETQARFELQELQNRFKRSSAATNLGIWYCDLPFAELKWSKETKDHFWMPENARVTIESFYEHIHPDDRELTRNAIEESIRGKVPYDIIYRTVNPNNPKEVKFIRAIGWAEYDSEGSPFRFDGITVDSTELHRISHERDESLEVLEALYKFGKTMSAELDQKKLVQHVTDAATQISKAEFGAFFYNVKDDKGEAYTLYAVSGVPLENFSKFPMPRNTEVFAPTFTGSEIIRSDDITKDPRYGKNSPHNGMPEGHLPVVSYLAVPVVSRSGEVIGGLFMGHKKPGMFTEKTERIVTGLASQAAIAMDNARLFDQANQAVQIRDEFMSISSHELRTPLTPLKMHIQGLARIIKTGQISTLPEEKVLNMITTADKQVNRLTTLVDDLLDVSRISTGKLTLNFEDVEIVSVINEIAERYKPQLESAHCELTLNLVDSLHTKLDRLRLEQILINLLTNAIKYAHGKTITISLNNVNNEAVIKVADEGPGISEADQKKIFDRFERVSTDTSQSGLGLGLYIVQQIVGAHGGSINVESTVGKGTVFTVKLPVIS